MRYQEAHAARSGSVPFTLYGKKTLQRVLSTAVAGVVALTPTLLISAPAQADIAGFSVSSTTVSGTEGGAAITVSLTRNVIAGGGAAYTSAPISWAVAAGSAPATTGADFTGTTSGTSTGAGT